MKSSVKVTFGKLEINEIPFKCSSYSDTEAEALVERKGSKFSLLTSSSSLDTSYEDKSNKSFKTLNNGVVIEEGEGIEGIDDENVNIDDTNLNRNNLNL